MTAPRWYVVPGAPDRTNPLDPVWTLSLVQDDPGWNTDMGFTGYGLTKAHAEELARAANSMWELRQMMFGDFKTWDSPTDLGLRASTDLQDKQT